MFGIQNPQNLIKNLVESVKFELKLSAPRPISIFQTVLTSVVSY